MNSLDGRVAIVTGAASGIGYGIAQVLAADGAAVVVADLDGSAAEKAAASLRDAGRDAVAAAADVVDRDAVERATTAATERWGRIDILAANAGVYPNVDLDAMSDAAWDHVMDVNVKGALHSIQACLLAMRRQRYGRIVLTSSITGPLVAVRGLAHYGASKSALLGMMRAAALEFAGDGITVNAVLPGNVRTPGIADWDEEMHASVVTAIPLGRLAEPEEIGWAVRFFASEEAAYITGQTLVVDGGQVLPEM